METRSEQESVKTPTERLKEVRAEILEHRKALEELKLEKRAIKSQLQDNKPMEVSQE